MVLCFVHNISILWRMLSWMWPICYFEIHFVCKCWQQFVNKKQRLWSWYTELVVSFPSNLLFATLIVNHCSLSLDHSLGLVGVAWIISFELWIIHMSLQWSVDVLKHYHTAWAKSYIAQLKVSAEYGFWTNFWFFVSWATYRNDHYFEFCQLL